MVLVRNQSGYEDVLKTMERILHENLKDSVGTVDDE